jgi:predicted Fe-S protein YdhL (DUF1289 family)
MSLPHTVTSPCIKVCILDGQGVCTGCGRTLEEIASWSRLPSEQQREVCELAARRRSLNGTRTSE